MKNFNRVLAAAVAVPVALSQILAVTGSAFSGAVVEVTTSDLTYVKPDTSFPTDVAADATEITFTQESTWNETVAAKLAAANGKTLTVDAKSVVNTLGTGYYVSVLKDIVNASENPTATISGSTITISGVADVSAYLVPDLNAKLAELGYDATIDASLMQGLSYTATITADLATSKEASADLKFTAGGVDYTFGTLVQYMSAVYQDLEAQIASITGTDSADLSELKEITDKLSWKIQTVTTEVAYYSTKTTDAISYSDADAVVAAILDSFEKHGVQLSADIPHTVDGLAASEYGSAFDKAVSSANTSFEDADVDLSIAITASDLATLAKSGSDFTGKATSGTYTIEFTIPDDEASAVETYAKAEVAKLGLNKTVKSVETEKVVTASVSFADGSVAFDVNRDVTVILEDPDTTTTTDTGVTTTTDSDVTTTATGDSDTTTTTVSGGDVTTTTGEGGTTTTGESTTSTAVSSVTDGTTTDGSGATTTTDDGSTTTTTDTSEVPVVPSSDISDVAVETIDADASEGVYFSMEDSFDATDLIKSVTINTVDGNTVVYDTPEAIATIIGFESTPAEVYATVVDANKDLLTEKTGKIFYRGGVKIYYKASDENVALEAEPEVLVAMKGDTDLNGQVGANDALLTLTYNSQISAGAKDVTFTDTAATDVLLEKLAYYVSDVDTESKAGKDGSGEDAAKITTSDALWILTYYSQQAAGNKDDEATLWADVLANKYLNQ